MSELTPTQASELRGEIDEIRRRLKEVEERLETRLIAAENKEAQDVADVRRDIGQLYKDLADLKRQLSDLSSSQDANHIGVLHVLSVLMRFVKVPPKEIAKAMKTAGAEHG